MRSSAARPPTRTGAPKYYCCARVGLDHGGRDPADLASLRVHLDMGLDEQGVGEAILTLVDRKLMRLRDPRET
jgi:hypothetical protein